jgi:hypothetical protein
MLAKLLQAGALAAGGLTGSTTTTAALVGVAGPMEEMQRPAVQATCSTADKDVSGDVIAGVGAWSILPGYACVVVLLLTCAHCHWTWVCNDKGGGAGGT